MTQNDLYWIWLQTAVGQGTAVVPRLLKAFSSAESVYRATERELRFLGLPAKVLAALCDKSLDGAETYAEQTEKDGGWLLTPDSPEYPESLHTLYSPPLVLYGKGTLPAWDRFPVIGIVGTRECTAYGEKAAGGIAAGLAAAGCPVVSGGARGVDRAAHIGALYGGGVTVAVQACGLNVEYPSVNRRLRQNILESGGALISEYPPGTVTSPAFFRVRNRIISGLSWGVCVIEAPKRSGALITAHTARDQGKDVFAVPGEITSPCCEGSNGLLQEGAIPVLSPVTILREYQSRCGNVLNEEEAAVAQRAYYDYYENASAPVPPSSDREESGPAVQETETKGLEPLPDYVSATARTVYEALGDTPRCAEELFEATGISLGEIFSALTELEVYGCIRNHPGQHYSR